MREIVSVLTKLREQPAKKSKISLLDTESLANGAPRHVEVGHFLFNASSREDVLAITTLSGTNGVVSWAMTTRSEGAFTHTFSNGKSVAGAGDVRSEEMASVLYELAGAPKDFVRIDFFVSDAASSSDMATREDTNFLENLALGSRERVVGALFNLNTEDWCEGIKCYSSGSCCNIFSGCHGH